MRAMQSKEEWEEWLAHPGTQAFRTMLVMWRESLKEQWAAGQFQETAANQQGLAQVQLLEDLADLDYQQYQRTMGVKVDDEATSEATGMEGEAS